MKGKFFSSAMGVLIALAAVFVVIGGEASTAGAQTRTERTFSGGIGEARLEMDLRREGESLSGSYYYHKSGRAHRLTLKGAIAADGSFKMQEMDAAGKQTGEFTGKWKQDPDDSGASLEGTWLKPGQTGEGAGFWAFEQMIYFAKTQITTREYKQSIKLKKATLAAEYPELSANANAAGFNQLAKARAMRSLAEFRKDLAGETAADIKLLGATGNYISVAYGIEYADDDLISVNFVENTFSGGAHPNLGTFTLTYDLKTGRELKLAELFKPGAKYLTTIAAYAMRDLKARKDPDSGDNMGLAQDIFEDGAKPTAGNYANWNVTKKGLLITFPPYQVAAYAYGPQTVIIPYSYLKDIVRPGGALANVKR
jgi:Protein of unknown function (DUF3298)